MRLNYESGAIMQVMWSSLKSTEKAKLDNEMTTNFEEISNSRALMRHWSKKNAW
jgi:hypothetical protein